MTLEEEVRADSIVEMNKGMLKAILDTWTVHGKDPCMQHMINAALTMTINDLEKVIPGTRLIIHGMLTREITKK